MKGVKTPIAAPTRTKTARMPAMGADRTVSRPGSRRLPAHRAGCRSTCTRARAVMARLGTLLQIGQLRLQPAPEAAPLEARHQAAQPPARLDPGSAGDPRAAVGRLHAPLPLPGERPRPDPEPEPAPGPCLEAHDPRLQAERPDGEPSRPARPGRGPVGAGAVQLQRGAARPGRVAERTEDGIRRRVDEQPALHAAGERPVPVLDRHGPRVHAGPCRPPPWSPAP